MNDIQDNPSEAIRELVEACAEMFYSAQLYEICRQWPGDLDGLIIQAEKIRLDLKQLKKSASSMVGVRG